MSMHNKIDYVEFPASDMDGTKRFFQSAFGWDFEDFGPDYTAFSNQGLDGGFFRSELKSTTELGSALLIIYSEDLEATQSRVEQSGGIISKPVFSFPGGRRFHFCDPSGNEYAVWAEPNAE